MNINQDRYEQAIKHVTQKSSSHILKDFSDLRCKYLFGHRLILSSSKTDNHKLNQNQKVISLIKELSSFEDFVAPFFSTEYLSFFNNDIYNDMICDEESNFKVSIYLNFDSNIAKNIHRFMKGDKPDKSEKFIPFLNFIKQHRKIINFEYSFYIAEEMKNEHLDLTKSGRLFEQIKSLKLFDQYTLNNSKEFTSNQIEQAEFDSLDTINSFTNNRDFQNFRLRQKRSYLVLLKALLLRWDYSMSLKERFTSLVEFTLDEVGKYSSVEVYYGWKLLTLKQHQFIDYVKEPKQINEDDKNIISVLSGMSWDIFIFRVQEQFLTNLNKETDFVTPFTVSYDKAFKSISKDFPVKCFLLNEATKKSMIIREDELEFKSTFTTYLPDETKYRLDNAELSLKRNNAVFDVKKVDEKISELENEIKQICSRV